MMPGVATVEGKTLRRLVDHVLDQRGGKPQPPVIAQDRARRGHDLDPAFGGLATGPRPPARPSRRRGCARRRPRFMGVYCPPSRPGRTGRLSSASGAARRGTRAARPPPRRFFLISTSVVTSAPFPISDRKAARGWPPPRGADRPLRSRRWSPARPRRFFLPGAGHVAHPDRTAERVAVISRGHDRDGSFRPRTTASL